MIRWCCVLLLLFSQQAALTHAISHVSRDAPAGHGDRVVTAPAHDEHDSGASAVCVFDAAFNQVLGGAAGACGAGDFSAGLHESHAVTTAAFVYCAFLAPLSRGPPVLL